jgi:hypothetical protein
VWRGRYERAWDGSIGKLARHSDGTLHAGALQDRVTAAQHDELVVVTDVGRVAELFEHGSKVYHTPDSPDGLPQDRLCIGGWFDGEDVHAPHLLSVDRGVWPGGQGPALPGGMTLVRLDRVPPFATGVNKQVRERLKQQGFKGLFHFDVLEDHETGEVGLERLATGWHWLHTQAFVAELESLSDTLEGGWPSLKRRFVTVLPVSVAPWPNEKSGKLETHAVAGLTPQQLGQLFWYDVTIDTKARRVTTAGLDGLVAVAVGSSDATPVLGRARAVELATRLQVPGKQFRPDVGGEVEPALATLEDRWGFSAV